jgi:dephospho-CoA kinase
MAKPEMVRLMLTVITGRPLSGKSTYVRTHAKQGDVVIDLDRIALAISTEDTLDHNYTETIRRIAMDARDAVIARALPLSNTLDVWLIHGNPPLNKLRLYELYKARIHHLDTDEQTCIARLQTRPEPTRTRAEAAILAYNA